MGTVKETIMQVSSSKKWLSKPALDEQGAPILQKNGKPVLRMNYEIIGGSLPAVVIRLNAGETIVSKSGGRTWMKGNVQTESKSEGGLKKMLGRALSGESLFMSRYHGKG